MSSRAYASLNSEKREALQIAKEFGYGEEVYQSIQAAKNSIQVNNALTMGRHSLDYADHPAYKNSQTSCG